MPKIEVSSNLEEGVKTAQRLKGELPESADDAAAAIADAWRREAATVMQSNGNVVTGTGIRSLETIKLGDGQRGVAGASYLKDLETGTDPHFPDTSNTRFISAARSYGMTRQALARVIAQQGTRAHPWMDETTARTFKTAKKRLGLEIRRGVQDSISLL